VNSRQLFYHPRWQYSSLSLDVTHDYTSSIANYETAGAIRLNSLFFFVVGSKKVVLVAAPTSDPLEI
jgi:hypothetical protein